MKHNSIGMFLLFPFVLCAFSAFSQHQNPSREIASYSFEIYKQLHQYPELGKREFKTAQLIKSELQKIGYTDFYDVPDLPTCIIAALDTKNQGPAIAFRADIDARPGKENTGLPYSSKVDTVTHSCGHDAHTSILLGTAKYLYSQKETLKGKIYFIFQPAEETPGGAEDIVGSGILTKLKIKNIYALHTSPKLPVGTVIASPGYFMAGSNLFTVQIAGKGSHAATPFEGSDIPLLTSQMVELISAIPSRRMNVAMRPCVISVTMIECGSSTALNILPTTAVIKGTIRSFEQVDTSLPGQASIKEILIKEITALCALRGATTKIEITKAAPPTYNNEKLFNAMIPELSKSFSGTFDLSPVKWMYAEDFSYYSDVVPCFYFGLGISKDKLGNENTHTNEFAIHPDALIFGIELFCDIAMINK